MAPFLRNRGRHSIDKLLISHGDTDHAGGFYGLVNSIEINQALLAPDFYRAYRPAIKMPVTVDQCIRGRDWKWSFFNPETIRTEWIYFNVLMPNLVSAQQEITSRNNNSCVLLIRWRDQVILLAGDIERAAERGIALLQTTSCFSASSTSPW